MALSVKTIEMLTSVAEANAVWRSSVQWGDRITIITANSVYTLIAAEDDSFIVSGGWFERQSASPAVVKVVGCSFGGAVVNRKLIGAPGLHLELGNRLVTTRIQQVIHERFTASELAN